MMITVIDNDYSKDDDDVPSGDKSSKYNMQGFFGTAGYQGNVFAPP